MQNADYDNFLQKVLPMNWLCFTFYLTWALLYYAHYSWIILNRKVIGAGGGGGGSVSQKSSCHHILAVIWNMTVRLSLGVLDKQA